MATSSIFSKELTVERIPTSQCAASSKCGSRLDGSIAFQAGETKRKFMFTTDKPSEGGEPGLPGANAKQPRWWKAVWWVERITLTSGLSLLAIVGVSRLERSISSQDALKAFTDSSTPIASSTPRTEEEERLTVPERAPSSEPADSGASSTKRNVPIAVLKIRKIDLEVPVFDGTDALTLNHAVGRIEGTAQPGGPGNMGIAGHRDTFFRGLKDIRKGDAIELTTREAIRSYTVDEIQVVTPETVSVLGPRESPSLTLVTCFPFYFVGSAPKRYVVMASLTGEQRSGPDK
jgi:sortase A